MRRPGHLLRLFAVVAAALALLLAGSPAHAAPSANGQPLSRAETPDTDELRERLADVVDAYQKSEDEAGALAKRTAKVTKRVDETKARLARSRDRVARIAQVAYINGGVDTSALALTSRGRPDEIADRVTTMSVLASADDGTMREAGRDRRKLDSQLADLKELKGRAKAKQAQLASQRDELNAALRKAAKLAAKRRAERRAEDAAKRKKERATRSRVDGRFTCPIGSPYTMMNTFGAPRGGGRSHEGVDIAAPKSTPIYAVEDATVSRAYSNTLGGIALILKGDSGDSYYYAHQEVNLVSTGQRVEAGQLVARVGMTGDAQGTIYHLHFERWPGGGSAVDPWPFLYPLCGKSG
ncbi:MAG: peptidoglycan DD-metalloendopeptidase family protein [Streptosporangiales bacterium]|nr:peptidoglycan DD-metalloendopeptidase family protein [Streptosporangiales bacterium]